MDNGQTDAHQETAPAATLRIWSEIETRRILADLHHSPPELWQERRTAGRLWAHFTRQAILPITAGRSTTLAELLGQLQTLVDHAAPAGQQCATCEAGPMLPPPQTSPPAPSWKSGTP